MAVGSSRLAEPVQIPDEYDLTIVSTSDDEAAIRHAIDADDFPTEEDPDDGDAGDDAGDATEETPGAGDTAAAPAKAADKAAPVVIDGEYEDAPAHETPDARSQRIERNVRRIQTLVAKTANQGQHISTLTEENARLRAQLDGRAPGRAEGDAATRETQTPAVPAFTFPTWDAYAQEHPDATHEEYIDARTDARVAFHDAKKDAIAEAERRRQAATTAQAEADRSIAAARTALPDWDAVVRASKAPLTDTMHRTMLKQGELGARIVYHLAKPENLAEAQRIAALDPDEQVVAILDLRDTVRPKAGPSGSKTDTAPEPATLRRRSSAAPVPLKPVPGEARNAPDLTDLDADSYMERMDESDKKRGRRR